MNAKIMVIIIVGFMMIGALPLLAEGSEEVPWAHILEKDLGMNAKPDNPGKPPKEDPPADPTQDTEILPWGVDTIEADQMTTLTGAGVNVAILDTGIDKDHPDLKVKGGVNFVPKGFKTDSTKWDDDNGHGTHVAGTIAALDNLYGVIGVAPKANLYAVKVLDRTGSGSLDWIIKGINWCVNNDIDIISMSLSTEYDYDAFETALYNAYQAGIVIVAAAGNDGSGVDYPAKYSFVVAVSAIDDNDNIAYWSNRGTEIDVAAPGVNILSTWNNGDYNTISGTSMACPHVSGVAALVLSGNPNLTPAQVTTALHDAVDLGATNFDPLYGYGRVDAVLATT